MKICILSHSYPRFPGDWNSNFIESLARAYSRSGAAVTVLTPFTTRFNRSLIDDHGVRIITFKYAPSRSWHTVGYGHSMIGDLEINPLDLLLMPLLLLAGSFRLAALLRQEQFDFVHAHWALPNTLIALLGRLLSGKRTRILTSFPGSDVRIISRSGWMGRLFLKIISRSDYLSCDGSDLGEDLIQAGLDPARIDYVVYGVNESEIHFSQEQRSSLRRRLGVANNELLLLMVGRFVAKKGFSTAFRALRRIRDSLPNIKMVVVGDGPLKPEYLSLLQADGVSQHVLFVGEVPTQDLVMYYSACDVFLMPSRRLPSHGLNVVVCEAMACARPIVASDIGGNRLVLFPGVNALLHAEDDSPHLADLVLQLAADPALRQRMGENSLRLVKERFNWDAIANHYIEKFRHLP